MTVHLKIEEARKGVMATLSQRDDEGKVVGHPTVGLVSSAADARQLAKTLARSLGLKVYRVIDKTKSASQPAKLSETSAKTVQRGVDPDAATEEQQPWRVPGVGKSF